MTWKSRQPTLQPIRSTWETDDGIHLSVSYEADQGQWWQYCALTFGAHTHQCHDSCLEKWPTEAIRIAREKLDKFEQKLNEEGKG
jgi:hypothetical protein